MDTTETYIKQSDCPEIQDGHGWEDGDCWAYFDSGLGYCTGIAFDCEDNYYSEPQHEPAIWLPRQDDLQEMVGIDPDDNFGWRSVLERFISWCGLSFVGHVVGLNEEITDRVKSMEQLWLAFYMKEVHSKTWENERWN